VPEKHYYMACLDLDGRPALVVGGGAVAVEKAQGLLDCGAAVTVVAPVVLDAFSRLPVEIRRRPYLSSDLEGRFLVIAATSDTGVNRQVHADAEARGVLCNVADVPELCNFILPAIHRAGPIAVAVSTGGASPALAQRLRDDVAALVGPRHVDLAHRLRELRPWAREELPTYAARRDYFARLVKETLG
jgi:precorrin-2 dehydrogenase/sirohydrochlorin ferrochelatase